MGGGGESCGCGAPLPAVVGAAGLHRCAGCGTVQDLGAALPATPPPRPGTAPAAPGALPPPPPGIRVREWEGGIEVTWRRASRGGFLMFLVFFLVGAAMAAGALGGGDALRDGRGENLILLGRVLQGAFAVALILSSLLQLHHLLGVEVFRVAGGRVQVRGAGFPWNPPLDRPLEGVRTFQPGVRFPRSKVAFLRTPGGGVPPHRGKGTPVHAVYAVDRRGEMVALHAGGASVQQADFIAVALRRGLPGRPAAGGRLEEGDRGA